MKHIITISNANTPGRIREFDYLKGVLIILVISFHLVYIEHLYPYAKQVVYTFHMPAFLVISGYLMNIAKPRGVFLNTLLGMAIPYIVMESGYVVMASMLPINEHIDHLTAGVFIHKLLLHPLGPYWYLHLLIICGATYYSIFRITALKVPLRIVLTGIIFYCYAHLAGMLSFTHAFYFLAGATLRKHDVSFTAFFHPTALSIAGFVLLIMHEENLSPAILGGILIVWLSVSSCLVAYEYSHQSIRSILCFLGRNSLLLYIFSPIFTILCKQIVPYLAFDTTGILFLVASLAVCAGGSLAIGYATDLLGISPLFFRKKQVLSL